MIFINYKVFETLSIFYLYYCFEIDKFYGIWYL